MKFTKKIIATLTVPLMFTVACKDDFLQVLPTQSLSEAQLTSEKGLEGALIGAYSMLLGRGGFYSGSSNWLWGSILGGDANKGSDTGDQSQVNEIQLYEPQAVNGTIQEKYERTYEGVARTNATMRLLANAQPGIAPATLTRITAETRFLRAHYYFELKRIYGDTPYVDENWNGRDPVPNDKNLYQFIEADMQYAVDNLPDRQNQIGRANKSAAKAYMGKIKLYQAKYQEALALFNDVINTGITPDGRRYDLVPNYQDIFRAANDNHVESIFSIQAAAGTGDINNANPDMVLNFPYNGGPAGCCGFFQPSFDLVNSFRVDANGLPLLDGSYNSEANRMKNDMGLLSTQPFTPDAGAIDPRLDWTAGRRGIPYLDWGPHPGLAWIRLQSWGGPYAPKKWVYYKSDEGTFIDGSSWTPGFTALNVEIIRFADVLLMAAECEVEVGSLERARELVNRVRARAANPNGWVKNEDATNAANYVIGLYNTPWSDRNVARDAVRFERKLELGMEGHRFFDLVRWGIAQQTLNAYMAHENENLPARTFLGGSFDAHNVRMPIPQFEIDLLGADVLRQNPGYN